MLNRLMLVAAAVACFTWSAFGRASYPEYAGEMGISFADNDLETDASEFTVYYNARFPRIQLNDRYPNELQPWAQRRSSVAIGMTTVDYESPANESKQAFVVNAVDFQGRDIGLSFSYGSGGITAGAPDLETPRYASFTGDFAGMVEREEVTSFGVIFNQFPSYLLRIDLDLNKYDEGAAKNDWEEIAIAVCTHPVGSRMLLETGLSATFNNSWGDHTDAYVSGVGYAGKAFAIGASIAAVFKGNSNRAATYIFTRFSSVRAKFDLGYQRDLDNDGGSALSLALGYRF